MRKDEKEVLQHQLDSEKAILKELEKQYKAALEAIDEKVAALLGRNDANLQHVIFQIEHQKALRRQIEGVLNQLHSNEFDTISDYLANCYEDGFIGSMYSMHSQGIPVIVPIDQNEVTKAVVLDSKISEGLYESIGVDVGKMKKSIRSEITRGISAGMSYNEIARNISKATKAPLSRAKTIVYTEGHRVQQASNYDGQRKAKSKGADVVKQWNSILDGNTRQTHRKLDGQIKEVEEPFEMDGKKAMYPGEFGDPAEDCNCRCVSMTRARWALDEEELQTLKDRAEYFGLDKSESFKDFKKKYLGAVKEIKDNESADNPATNKFGDTIIFSEKMNTEKWKPVVDTIKELSNEFETRLTSVKPGSFQAAGSVDMGGAMWLSSASQPVAIHEFAHSIAMEALTKYGVVDDSNFWKEIKAVKRAYRKDVGDDTKRWISAYEHGRNLVDEFFAEAFAQAKANEMGIPLPDYYGTDLTYSKKVLEITKKYFGK